MITYETLKSFCSEDLLRPALQYACRRADGWWASDGSRIICVPMDECQQGDLRFYCNELPKEAGNYPNVENVVDVKSFTPKFIVTTKAINHAMSKLPVTDEMVEVEREMKFVECPECGGDGEIEISETIHFRGHWLNAEATCECPVCHGYGQIPDKEDYNPKNDDYDPDSPEYSTMVPTGRKVPDVNGTLLHIPFNAYFKAAFALDLLRVAREQGVDEIECSGSNYRDVLIFRMHGVIVGLMPSFVCSNKFKSVDVKVNDL